MSLTSRYPYSNYIYNFLVLILTYIECKVQSNIFQFFMVRHEIFK
jgi:hypothetical protein